MNVQILGCTELRAADGRNIAVSPTVSRLLATLAWSANSFVTDEDTIRRVWESRIPVRPRDALYTLVTRLRKALRSVGAPGTPCDVVRRPGGYTMVATEESVDVLGFRALVRQARNAQCRGAEEAALQFYEQALALCHGRPLSDVRTAWADAARITFEQELRTVRTNSAELALGLGRCGDYVPLLHELAAAHPLDERIASLLMLALHRSGRQDEALRCFRSTRARLVAELGVEPGSRLRMLHERILRRDEVVQGGRPVWAAMAF
ncbi:AfsR/SARP family transcriptional regulator [Streptomyces coelicoflavus]|uniref:AfsR/SARP family transcriptional regulator n=1 Tax=Streptomyces coelicoflavus TaxID=285562 RepID=UPI00210A885C|nr:AfsR/SARP family transcriptional regulator [Streptomyces coelicoflavus]MCQ4203029.1 AfsR/SARP family transcriptional regulator [Streptomyces coelicoflavus]